MTQPTQKPTPVEPLQYHMCKRCHGSGVDTREARYQVTCGACHGAGSYTYDTEGNHIAWTARGWTVVKRAER